MGWSYTHRDKGTSNVEYFRADWERGGTYQLLDGATVGGTFYAAIRGQDGEVFAAVTLTRWVRDVFNFGTKDMTEHMGPVEARCPDRILDLLTPTTDETANAWRAKCREHNARIASVKRGSVIEHAGSRYVAVDLRRNLFRSEASGLLLRWSWWRSTNDLQVVA